MSASYKQNSILSIKTLEERIRNYKKVYKEILRQYQKNINYKNDKYLQDEKNKIESLKKEINNIDVQFLDLKENIDINNYINTFDKAQILLKQSDNIDDKLFKYLSQLKLETNLIIVNEINNFSESILNFNTSLDNMISEIQKLFKNIEDKVLVKKIISENEEKYLNLKNIELIQEINFEIDNYWVNNKFDEKKLKSMLIDFDIFDKLIYKKTIDEAIRKKYTTIEAFNKIKKLFEENKVHESLLNSIKETMIEMGYHIFNEDIYFNEVEKKYYIHGENSDAKQLNISINLNGELIYDFDGFENHDHDIEFEEFTRKIKKHGIFTDDILDKIYREPKFARNKYNSQNKVKVKEKKYDK